MNSRQPPSVTVVVLNWNGWQDTLSCVDSLRKADYPSFRTIIVDNGSTDGSMAHLRAAPWADDVTFIETGCNLGFAEGNNVGIRHALEHGADFVLVLNNDTTVAPDLLDRLVDGAARHPDAGVFSARLLYMDEPGKVWFDGARWDATDLAMKWPGQGQLESAMTTEDHETDYACGASLFFRAEVARQIGLLDDRFFLVWEEVDWCFRARAAGWRCLVIPDAKVWHRVGASFGGEDSPMRTYFSVRNELLWFRLHAPLSGRLRLWAKVIKRLVPIFHVDHADGAPFAKRLAWAAQDYLRSLMGRGTRFTYLATRRAISDYVHGRFGDCPPQVRAWSQAWAARRGA